MKSMKRYLLLLLPLLLMTSCGESLFDTYKDFAGDGEIRYVGKVSDLTASPGWQRILLDWKNSDDPIIDKMEVKWVVDDKRDSVFLPAGTTSYVISNLTQGNSYEVTVCSVDKEGRESLPTTTYVRPYNQDHEAVLAFNRVVARSFFLHNHLLLTFNGWDNNIKDAYLAYRTKSNGEEKKVQLTEEVVDGLHLDLPDVDAAKPVSIYRKGYIEGCADLITFAPINLETEPLFNSEFKQEMKRQFGYDVNIPESFYGQCEQLDLDWKINDLADLLYFPKLKKLYLGKNRHVRPDMVDDEEVGQSQVTDVELSDWVLAKLHELNGLEVYRYDKHFSTLTKESYVKDMGHSPEHDVTLISMKGAKVTVMPEESQELTQLGWSSHPEYLVDGNENTSWKPYVQNASTTYTIDVELPADHTVKGMRLVQSYYGAGETAMRALCPAQIRVYKSVDGGYFPVATNLEDTNIGNSTGEVNYIPFAKAERIKYVRIVVTTPMYFKNFQVSLAEIGLY